MCGLTGYSGPEPMDVAKMKILMYINSIERGGDATGIYSPINGLKKDTVGGWQFVTDGVVNIEPDNTFIGHVRAKTVGHNIVSNAHPFMRDNCVLAHNGTLTNHYAILRDRGLPYNEYDVDSDIICGAIAKDGNFNVLSQLDGAAALLIHDRRNPKLLYVFRKGGKYDSQKRPLYKGYIGANLYISSVFESLVLIGCKSIKEFKEDYLYTISEGRIIGSPRKVKNNPLSYNYTTNTSSTQSNTSRSSNFSMVNYGQNSNHNNASITAFNNRRLYLNQAVNCLVRCTKDITITLPDDNRVAFVKDKYYEIVGVPNENTYRMWHDTDAMSVSVSIMAFNPKDIIRAGDYVKFIRNAYVAGEEYDAPVIKADEIIKVDTSHPDGDAGFDGLIDDNTPLYIRKNFMIKLTEQELEVYLEAKSREADTKKVDDVEAQVIDLTKPPFRDVNLSAVAAAVLGGSQIEDVEELVDIQEHPNYNALDDDDDYRTPRMTYHEMNRTLPKHFKDMDMRLEGLKIMLNAARVDDDTLNQLNDMIYANYKIANEMYKDA